MAPDAPNSIVLFGYGASPYARRVKAYLALRNIAYAECIQPPILPRPDLNALGVQYRRIPVLAIGRDVYVDSRCIVRRLEELFPPSSAHPALSSPETSSLARILTRTVADPGGVFVRATQFLDGRFGAMRDPAFLRDRAEFFGKGWGRGDDVAAAQRREAVGHMRLVFGEMEDMLVGREWIAGTEGLSIADFEAVWPLDWLLSDLQPPQEHFNNKEYPRTFAWIARYRAALKAATSRAGKPVKLSGEEAVSFVTGASFTDRDNTVDINDPLGLAEGAAVEVFPTDGGGFSHRDRGRLIKLTREEVVIAVEAKNGKEIRIHAPRWNFRIGSVGGAAKL